MEPERQKPSGVDSLKQRLYSRGSVPRQSGRSKMHSERYDVPEDWEHDHVYPDTQMRKRKRKGSFATKFLVAAIIFFLVAVGVAALVITRGANVVSSKNVDIVVSGPAAVAGGEELSLQVEVTNRNSTTLETADFLVEFPDGTRSVDDTKTELKRTRESLGDVAPGSRKTVDIKALVFGEEGEKQEVVVAVEYRIAGSNAIFVKEKLFTFEISSAPLTLVVDVPREINSGQRIDIKTGVVSNAPNIIEDVLLVAEYPFGFEFIEATPDPSFGNNVWNLGDLAPGGKRSITIVGTVTGQDNEERTIRFTSGIVDEGDERSIGTPFLSIQESLTIKRPFIDLNVALNGSSSEEYVTSGGSNVRADIIWTNNLPVRIENAIINARFEGSALDESSVSADHGFYRSIDNTVVWDQKTERLLGSLEPGDSGQVSFTFKSKNLSQNTQLTRPEIAIFVTMSGTRLSDGNTTGPVVSEASRIVRFASDVGVGSRAVHFVGPFSNSGPMPPEVDTETTYTIIWSVNNSSNNITDVEVQASLPSYVEWLGVVNPSGEDVTFSSVGGQVLWRAGTVSGGTGYTKPAREVAFKVRLTPSVSQVGTIPQLIGQTNMTGRDEFADTVVNDVAFSITTKLSTDPQFVDGQGRVVE